MRVILSLLLAVFLTVPLTAASQTAGADRAATGGAPTLEDIMARQRGEVVDDSTRRTLIGDPDSAAAMTEQLGTLGGSSDPELWRALRFNSADITVSAGGDVAKVLVQDGGMAWYKFRSGPLSFYGGWLLLGTLIALAAFYLLRGKIMIDEDMTGRTVTRFKFIERLAHWTLAGSFILLGFTGLFVKYGREFIAPYLGAEFNALLLQGSKFVHNNVSWAFMLALVTIFVMWVWHNIPNRTDLTWLAQAGGIVGKKHPPAKKFNAGQKIIFWSCIVLGGSISVSGLSLLFPFELPLFAKTFAVMNDMGLPGLVGMSDLPTVLAPQEEMALAQAWHAIVSFVLMAIIIAHIYIGSIGMQGAFDAMGTGEVDEAWAHQHHSIWLDEVKAKQASGDASKSATPAE